VLLEGFPLSKSRSICFAFQPLFLHYLENCHVLYYVADPSVNRCIYAERAKVQLPLATPGSLLSFDFVSGSVLLLLLLAYVAYS
jgi:hypothetical protein